MIILFKCLVVICMHTILHELMHMLFAVVILNTRIECIHLGTNIMVVKIGKKFEFSPVFIGGYVEVKREELLKKSKLLLIMFFEIAPFINLLVSLYSLYFVPGVYGLVSFIFGTAIFVSSNIPEGETDLHTLTDLLVKKKKNK